MVEIGSKCLIIFHKMVLAGKYILFWELMHILKLHWHISSYSNFSRHHGRFHKATFPQCRPI